MENVYYGFLLQFITDIKEYYYGCYGTFLKDFVDSGPRSPKKAPKPSYIWGNPGKIGPIYNGYYRILRILRNITVRNISPTLEGLNLTNRTVELFRMCPLPSPQIFIFVENRLQTPFIFGIINYLKYSNIVDQKRGG
jgi:hypothetical protein